MEFVKLLNEEKNKPVVKKEKIPSWMKKILGDSKVSMYSYTRFNELTGNDLTTYIVQLKNFGLYDKDLVKLSKHSGFTQITTDDGSFGIPNPTKAPLLLFKSI